MVSTIVEKGVEVALLVTAVQLQFEVRRLVLKVVKFEHLSESEFVKLY